MLRDWGEGQGLQNLQLLPLETLHEPRSHVVCSGSLGISYCREAGMHSRFYFEEFQRRYWRKPPMIGTVPT